MLPILSPSLGFMASARPLPEKSLKYCLSSHLTLTVPVGFQISLNSVSFLSSFHPASTPTANLIQSVTQGLALTPNRKYILGITAPALPSISNQDTCQYIRFLCQREHLNQHNMNMTFAVPDTSVTSSRVFFIQG